MMYTEDTSLGKSIEFVDVDQADRQALFAYRPSEVEEFARDAVIIENHYGRPMDIEWAKDGLDGGLYILQARPETVTSRRSATLQESYQLLPGNRVSPRAERLVKKLVKVLSEFFIRFLTWRRSSREMFSLPI
jgi:pyruvate, water dikinase